MSELKPCPFCAGDAEEDASSFAEYHGHEHQDSTIRCKTCEIEVTVYAHDTTGGFSCSCCHDIPAEARKRWNRRAPVSTPQQSAQRASVDTPTDEQISAIYRSTFPRGPYLVTPDVHKFARAILAWGSAGSGATNRLKSDEVKNG